MIVERFGRNPVLVVELLGFAIALLLVDIVVRVGSLLCRDDGYRLG